MKLNQVIALEKGVKSTTYNEVTKIHRDLGKTGPMSGISRTYKPRDDEGEQFPPESTLVQVRATDVLARIAEITTKLFDLTLIKDSANMAAKADLEVDGTVLAKDVPVTYLLFLEKQLKDLETIVTSIPTLDPSEHWEWDENVDAFATEPSQTVKTKKVPRNHVKAAATDKHPAQVEVYTEDVVVGNWTTVKYSGALPASEVREMRARVIKLQEAVKKAREEANSIVVADQKIGAAIFEYLQMV